jgi:hypothetical protein
MNEVVEAPASVLAQQPQQAQPLAVQRSQEASNLIQVIADAARDPAVDINKMERLWEMHERMKNRAAEEAFNAAMNKAQAEMGRVAADAANPQTKSLYATYGKLDAMVRPVYTRNGFSVSFDEGEGAPEGHLRMLAYVSHSAGHTRTYKADIPNDGKGAKGGDVMTKTHATGAGKSYGKRYMLKDIFNIAIGEEDNDGNGEGAQTAEEAAASRLELWTLKAGAAATLADLRKVTGEAAKAFSEARDKAGYAAFGAAAQARASVIKAAEAKHAEAEHGA